MSRTRPAPHRHNRTVGSSGCSACNQKRKRFFSVELPAAQRSALGHIHTSSHPKSTLSTSRAFFNASVVSSSDTTSAQRRAPAILLPMPQVHRDQGEPLSAATQATITRTVVKRRRCLEALDRLRGQRPNSPYTFMAVHPLPLVAEPLVLLCLTRPPACAACRR